MTRQAATEASTLISHCFMRCPSEPHVLVQVEDGFTSRLPEAREFYSVIQDYFMLPPLLIERHSGRIYGRKDAVSFAQTAIDPAALRWVEGRIEF